MKKLLALCLVMALFALLFASCSSQPNTAQTASAEAAQQPTEPAAVPEPAEEPDLPAPEESVAAPEEPVAAPAEPAQPEPPATAEEPTPPTPGYEPENEEALPEISTVQIEYPFDEEVTFSVFYAINSGFNAMISSWTQAPTLPYLKEQIGVNFDFIEPSEMTASEQFNLVIASGDYPD